MALVRASRQSPNQRLSQAIARFASEVSSEEQDQLQINHLRALGVDDVMSLTAEIDRLATNRITESRRCYGPRITSFLEGIQEFAKAADQAVGIAKSPIATGVWTAVRFLLLAGIQASNPYIDKLSDLFLTLGRSAHRFREMAILFPRSKHLQDAVFEYYIVVVDMCYEILKLSKKSNLSRYWNAFTEETYTAKLDRCAQQIMVEVVRENAELQKEESRQNSIFRLRSKQNMELESHHRQRVLRKELLDACSTHDYKRTWKQTRALGNTLLFKNSDSYVKWRQSRKSCTLLYHGKLGSGKSVLLANIVDDLYLARDSSVQVIYFFSRHDLPDSLLPRTMLGCIARQLLQHRPDIGDLARFIDIDSSLSTEDLLDLIKRSTMLPIYLILDGIDDCQRDSRDEILESLQHLQQHLVLNICISARDRDNSLRNDRFRPRECLTAALPAPNPDIDAYIEHEIDQRLETGRLIIDDPALVAKVKSTLQSRAEDMFLWVYLQIVCLCLMETDYEIESALENLPTGLSETYARLLQKRPDARHRHQLFQMVLSAREPLTKSQLREALSVEPGNTEFNPKKVLNTIDRIVESSAGLLIIDEEEDTVRLVHHSVTGFLTSSAYQPPISLGMASTTLTHIVLTYLNYSLLETQLTLRGPRPKLVAAAIPGAILMATLPLGKRIIKPSRDRNLDRQLAEYSRPSIETQKDFLSYAKPHWLTHVMDTQLDTRYLSLLRTALDKGRIGLPKHYMNSTPLQMAVSGGRLDLLNLFLEQDLQHEDVIRSLDILVSREETGENFDMVDLFDRYSEHISHEDMLTAMVHCISPSMCRIMLDSHPDITSQTLNEGYESLEGRTPLMFGLFHALTPITEVLLEDSRTDRYLFSGAETPFLMAIRRQYVFGTKLLSARYLHLDVGPEMEHEIWMTVLDPDYPNVGTAENAAKVVEILLNDRIVTLDFEFDSDAYNGYTPLMMACENGLYHTVKVILEFDSNCVNESSVGKSPESEPRSTWYGNKFKTSRIASRYTAWDFAIDSDIKALLEEYGGKGWEDLNRLQKKR